MTIKKPSTTRTPRHGEGPTNPAPPSSPPTSICPFLTPCLTPLLTPSASITPTPTATPTPSHSTTSPSLSPKPNTREIQTLQKVRPRSRRSRSAPPPRTRPMIKATPTIRASIKALPVSTAGTISELVTHQEAAHYYQLARFKAGRREMEKAVAIEEAIRKLEGKQKVKMEGKGKEGGRGKDAGKGNGRGKGKEQEGTVNVLREFKKVKRRGYVCPGTECKNALCYHFGFVKGMSGNTKKPGAQLDVLTKLLMDKAWKDGFKVSVSYAVSFMKEHDNKIVPALLAIKEDILSREQALKDTGRVSFQREALLAKGYNEKGRTRDQIILFFERDDQNLRELLDHGWDSSYGKMLMHYSEPQRTQWFDLYVDEGDFREERQAYYSKLLAELKAGNIKGGMEAVEEIMSCFDAIEAHTLGCQCQGCHQVRTIKDAQKNRGGRGKGEMIRRLQKASSKKQKSKKATLAAATHIAEETAGVRQNDCGHGGGEIGDACVLAEASVRPATKEDVIRAEAYDIARRRAEAPGAAGVARISVERNRALVIEYDADAKGISAKEFRKEMTILADGLTEESEAAIQNYIEDFPARRPDISPSQLDFLAGVGKHSGCLQDPAPEPQAGVKGKAKGKGKGKGKKGADKVVEKSIDVGAETDRLYERLRFLHDDICGELLEEPPFSQGDLKYVQEMCKIPVTSYASTYLSLGGGSRLLAVAYQEAAHEEITAFFHRIKKLDTDFDDFYIVVLEFFDDYILRRAAEQRRLMGVQKS